MKKYVRKPAAVEAIQYTGEITSFLEDLSSFSGIPVEEITLLSISPEQQQAIINDANFGSDEDKVKAIYPIIEIKLPIVGNAGLIYGDYVTKTKNGELMCFVKEFFELIHREKK